LSAVAVERARNWKIDPQARWRADFEAAYIPRARKHFDGNRVKLESGRVEPEPDRVRFEPGWRAAPRESALERAILRVSALLLLVGAVGCLWVLYTLVQLPREVASSRVAAQPAAPVALIVESGKEDALAASIHPRIDRASPPDAARKEAVGALDRSVRPAARSSAVAADDTPAAVVAREWSLFEPTRAADRDRVAQTRTKTPPARLAALESPPPQAAARPRITPEPILPRLPSSEEAKTTLVSFATAPFPYDGRVPGSNRPFLDAGEAGHRGHTNFRGRVFWESETYNDNRVLLHIPPRFDPNRPAVMVVFFHGHGANLARDVRDRQRVPAQIAASGVNAVLVAPQFAVDAADSSAGRFWEPGGFKQFVDEAADQLARVNGDPRAAQAFADMPIVIVAYSGGFGPLLSVLARGEAKSRLRGVVLLDALYGGMDSFANWIAANRSAFFVSSFTPHTRSRNAELGRMLSDRSVPYGSELRRDHLNGMVAFLPAGDISHRDFVTHAWADNPIADILARMDEFDPKMQIARQPAAAPSAATASAVAASPRN